MTIEIYAPHLKINEMLIDDIKTKLASLSHLSEKISRAEVFLQEEGKLKSCKIRLDIFGDTLFVHKTGKRFQGAVSSAMSALRRLLKAKVEQRNEPVEEIISTVKV
jgi:putative sigma-54 modulation protein